MAATAAQLPETLDQRRWTPDERELADLELLLSGGYPALSGLLSRAEVDSVLGNSRLTTARLGRSRSRCRCPTTWQRAAR